jgi:hypothetical protein
MILGFSLSRSNGALVVLTECCPERFFFSSSFALALSSFAFLALSFSSFFLALSSSNLFCSAANAFWVGLILALARFLPPPPQAW